MDSITVQDLNRRFKIVVYIYYVVKIWSKLIGVVDFFWLEGAFHLQMWKDGMIMAEIDLRMQTFN